ncbi:A disintegrin and metalloproteinase with thrombospondin motifs 7-like [Corticium candelabrum]|uniref:A disintegrin and metalloproteinase with thrombospondin motifs 7-like n=1 Tax=Corticium candelabrum TaxID=121492 RepID=UPI002E25B4E1|nr:A disintegrin and metalloproteinase with thrombospondin motifs 7-like [Corticium candelabrum]
MRQKSVVVLAVVLLTSFNIFLVSSQRGQTTSALGTWGSWSDWTSCSRTCDAGVQSRIRSCFAVSQNCLGNPKEFRSCSGLQRCPSNAPDYRSEQCSQFNNNPVNNINYEWIPVDLTPNKCMLNCKARGYPLVKQLPAVVDGTACKDGSSDICVDGICRPAGCNGMLGSRVKLDRCGVCGGDGTSCVVCNGTVMRRTMRMTHNKLFTIPRHAKLIEVRELVDTANVLAIRRHSNKVYYLNSGVMIDQPGQYEISGTLFTYKYFGSDGYAGTEMIKAPGPLSYDTDIMLRYQTLNLGIRYSYTLPKGQTCTLYTWHHSKTLTKCSATCGGGISYRPVECVSIDTGSVVSDRHCRRESKPHVEQHTCNNRHCPPDWKNDTDWSPCSVSCGRGIQTRRVICSMTFSSQYVSKVSDLMCTKLRKPATSQACELMPCRGRWLTGDWSRCSTQCGVGIQTRTVRCQGDGSCDPTSKPPQQQRCETECQFVWYSSPWSDCSATCDKGVQTRTVKCFERNGEEVDNSYCNETNPPIRSQECRSKKECEFSWFTGPWSACSASCNTGRQIRLVTCLSQLDQELEIYPSHNCKKRPPLSSRPCTRPACPSEWYATEWSCCNAGKQSRSLLCPRPLGRSSLQCGRTPTTHQDCDTADCKPDNSNNTNNLYTRDKIPRNEGGDGEDGSKEEPDRPLHGEPTRSNEQEPPIMSIEGTEPPIMSIEGTEPPIMSIEGTESSTTTEAPTTMPLLTSNAPTTQEPTPTTIAIAARTKPIMEVCGLERSWCKVLRVMKGRTFYHHYCSKQTIAKTCCLSCRMGTYR